MKAMDPQFGCRVDEHSKGQEAFTRLDAGAVLGVLAVLVVVVWPVLAENRSRSDQIICANNLRQVAMGFLIWGHDHGDARPFDVSIADGGTQRHLLAPNPWLHFSWISNELRSPKILSCPSDVSGRLAKDFSADPNGGYVHPNFANNATSYFLSHGDTVPHPAAIFGGDRNLKWDDSGQCTWFNFSQSLYPPVAGAGWNKELHQQQGNLMFFDGHVEQVSNLRFNSVVLPSFYINNLVHVIIPR